MEGIDGINNASSIWNTPTCLVFSMNFVEYLSIAQHTSRKLRYEIHFRCLIVKVLPHMCPCHQPTA